jgi:integrase/recombinase XerD
MDAAGRQRQRAGRQRQGVAWAVDPTAPAIAAVGPGTPGSFVRLVPAWLGDLAVRGYAAASRQTWAAAMGLFAAWASDHGLTEAGQVTRAVLEAYQRHLYRARSGFGRGPRTTGRLAQAGAHPLAVRTQRSRLHAVDRFYAWAVRRGHVPANPAADLDLPRKPHTLPDYLTPAEADAVLAQCDTTTPGGIRDRAFLELLYATGLRRSEALSLGVHAVDLDRGVVQVLRGKGGKDRYCPLGVRAARWLARYQTEVRSRWCIDASDHRLFLDADGRAMSSGALGGRLHRYLVGAGITKRGACHLFRHAFATGLVEGGCDVRLIAAMLGHADLASTMLYTRVGIGQLIAAHRLCHPGERTIVEPAPSVDGRA